jgi:hypothetical protein
VLHGRSPRVAGSAPATDPIPIPITIIAIGGQSMPRIVAEMLSGKADFLLHIALHFRYISLTYPLSFP